VYHPFCVVGIWRVGLRVIMALDSDRQHMKGMR
jgi:hypothetical protein